MTDDKSAERMITDISGMLSHAGRGLGWNSERCIIMTEGIEAIREMQAELAGREAVEVLPDRTSNDVWERLYVTSCENAAHLRAQWEASQSECDVLKEELRTVRASWEFQGGERIIAERDELRKENCSLVATRHAAREDAIDSHRKYIRLQSTMTSLGKQLVDEASCA